MSRDSIRDRINYPQHFSREYQDFNDDADPSLIQALYNEIAKLKRDAARTLAMICLSYGGRIKITAKAQRDVSPAGEIVRIDNPEDYSIEYTYREPNNSINKKEYDANGEKTNF